MKGGAGLSLSKFIISRCTAEPLLKDRASKSGELIVPCNFRKNRINFQYDQNSIYYKDRRYLVPTSKLEEAVKKNIAFEVSIHPEGLEFIELSAKTSDGEIFYLKEPEQEREIMGPILELSGVKMHLSKGYKTTTEFSQKLARAAKVSTGHNVLDLFFGQGYSASECIELGAKKVYLFEKYPEVIELAKRNPFSVFAKSENFEKKRFKVKICDISKSNTFFKSLTEIGVMFDSMIIDPPKKNVMLQIYTSTSFLRKLSEFLIPNGTLSAYVPEGGISPRFAQMRKQIINTFHRTEMFEFTEHFQNDPFIFCFKKNTTPTTKANVTTSHSSSSFSSRRGAASKKKKEEAEENRRVQ